MMKVLVLTESIHPEYGGPSVSIPSLMNRLSDNHDIEYSIATVSKSMIMDNPLLKGRDVLLFKQIGSDKIRFSIGFFKYLWSNAKKYDYIYSNNLWNYVSFCAFLVSWLRGVKHIIAPRGSLTSWSLSQGWFRKKVMLKLFQKQALSNAIFIHVTSEEEIDNIRSLNVDSPCINIPHGIDSIPRVDKEFVCKKLSLIRNDKKYFLFMSRLHKKKGLDLLLSVWSNIYEDYPEYELLIAGPDYGNYIDIISKKFHTRNVTYIGVADKEMKSYLFSVADFFVLPTYSENFGVVVGEALSAGLPVITTTGAPWSIIEEIGCGKVIDLSFDNLMSALHEMFSKSKEDVHNMSMRAMHVINDNYSWENRAENFKKALEVYFEF